MHLSRWTRSNDSYFGVRCRKCRTPILFAADHSGGETVFETIRKLTLTCPSDRCGHRDDYSNAKVSRFSKKD